MQGGHERFHYNHCIHTELGTLQRKVAEGLSKMQIDPTESSAKKYKVTENLAVTYKNAEHGLICRV